VHPEQAERAHLLGELAHRHVARLVPLRHLRSYAVGREGGDGVANGSLLVVEQPVDREQLERGE
jgi:hypothetical protein